jgi:hypothetical protein
MDIVGKLDFLQDDRSFASVGRGESVQVDHRV